jgi:hypothetical protein
LLRPLSLTRGWFGPQESQLSDRTLWYKPRYDSWIHQEESWSSEQRGASKDPISFVCGYHYDCKKDVIAPLVHKGSARAILERLQREQGLSEEATNGDGANPPLPRHASARAPRARPGRRRTGNRALL